MKEMHPLQRLTAMQKQGHQVGIYSACSANAFVLEAALRAAKRDNAPVLIEATSNQVNQYGGYTGMLPKDFYCFVEALAAQVQLPMSSVILGGDHLGPLTWTHLPEVEAMKEACALVRCYVSAGFTKIHIDTSMRVADDANDQPLATSVIAKRGAMMAKAAEEAYAELLQMNPAASAPVYIVGSEVPIPGGAQSEEEGLQVTRAADFTLTVQTFQDAFAQLNLQDAWERVIAVVVQPGVEFGDETIHEYNRAAAKNLTHALTAFPKLVFEGHSTDYQSRQALRNMVEDGIAILKVGPGLTFALREALFSLAHIEEALMAHTGVPTSRFIEVLEEVMLESPGNWKKHYHGTDAQLAFKRKYSFSDRCRYYLPNTKVQAAMEELLRHLQAQPIPLSLLSAYMPVQYAKVRSHCLANEPTALLLDHITTCIDDYLYATKQDCLTSH